MELHLNNLDRQQFILLRRQIRKEMHRGSLMTYNFKENPILSYLIYCFIIFNLTQNQYTMMYLRNYHFHNITIVLKF